MNVIKYHHLEAVHKMPSAKCGRRSNGLLKPYEYIAFYFSHHEHCGRRPCNF